MKHLTVFASTSMPLSKDYPSVLHDARAIADYIEEQSSSPVSREQIEELFRDQRAVLREVPTARIKPGPSDGHARSRAFERQYRAMNPDTMPPIVLEDNIIQDGNHRFRVFGPRRDKMWAYVVEYVDA